MIEPDINERMARFAPSQNMGDAGDDAIERAVAGMAGMPARPQFEQDADIDAAVLQIAGERRQDMAASLMAASQVNPDQAARASKLGDQFGVGQDIALRNMQELEREATVRDIQRMDLMRNDPVLARYLSDRAFASEAQDDVGILAKLRPVFVEAALVAAQGPLPVLSRGYERGSAIAERGAIGTKAMVGLAQPEDLEQAKRLQQRMHSLGQMGILGTTAEMIGQNVAQLRGIGTTAVAGAGVGSLFGPAGTAVGGALGATAGVIATTAEMEAGNLYLDLQEEGVSEETAIPVAIAGGFLNGVIEVVGMKVAAKPFQALAQRVMREAVADAIKKPTMRAALAAAGKGYLMQVGAEGAEEALQETVIIAGEEIAKAIDGVDSETGMREAVDRVLESFMYGAMGASILGGIGPGANLFVDLRRASNTERQQRFFEGLAANNKESRLAQRSPVAYERFLEAQAEGAQAETIYVDGRIAQQVLAQSGVPTAQLEEILPGIRERISEAVQTGGDVTIPTARFGARLANTELGNALLPHMRLSPDAMSATEAQEFATRRQDVVREAEQILAQKQEADATFVQQARQIEDTLASQIVATGQMDEKAARTSAQFMRDFYVTQAAALGMSPQQVYERFPVRVEGAMALAAAPMAQAAQKTLADVEKAFAELNVEQRLTETDTAIRPGIIRVPQELRAQGRATNAMQQLIAYADQVGKRIDVSPTAEFGANKKRLLEWYKSLGFVENKGRNKDFAISATMYRVPQPAAPGVMEQADQFDQAGQRRTDTPEFKAWSRNAPIFEADEPGFTTGTPMVVKAYHGTNKTFVEFKMDRPAWFAARPGTAGQYVAGGRRKMGDKPGRGSQTIPVYLSFQNPLDLRYNIAGETTVSPQSRVSMADVLEAAGLPNDEQALRTIAERNLASGFAGVAADIEDKAGVLAAQYANKNKLWSILDDQGLIETLKEAGFDGLILSEGGNIFAALNDKDIKSVNNRGTWSRTSPNIMEQAAVLEQAPVNPGFYSALEREVASIDAKALTASGWGERFKGLISKGAIKADELEWSGLADYLKMQEGKVSKDAVLEFLRGNGVQVERTYLGRADNIMDLRNAEARAEMEYDDALEAERAAQALDEATWTAADAALTAARQRVVAAKMARQEAEQRSPAKYAAKYAKYTLPGGTNYREVLLTLPFPPSPDLPGRVESLPNGMFRVAYPRLPDAMFATRQEADADLANKQSRDSARAFRSTHWDQPNVLVHLRMNDRVDADGKRVLFVEEVQSDWGQQGKKVGFVATEKRRQEIEQEYRDAEAAVAAATPETRQAAQERFDAAMDVYNEELNNRTIARAPFVETTDGWLNLGLKQVMLEAVRGNYDRVAFVNGQQSADRYDLSKQVESIMFNKNMDGTFNYQVTLRDVESDELDGNSKTLQQIEETFGKEIAQKMDSATPADTADATEQEDMFPNELSGLDLKVGGEGMKSFYDKIVPIAMGKLLKKYGGGKIGTVVLPNMKQQELEADAERMGMTVSDVLDVAEESEYAQAQPGFDITPEMVTKLESGLPLFQAAPGPARGGFDPKRLTTILNKTADLSTFLHESAHAFLTFYEQVAATPDAPARIVNDMDELLRWFKIDGATPAERIANWNGLTLDQKRKYHETFAYNFEVYLFDGKAPSTEMQGLFERFSAWLKRVYRSIRDDLNAIYRREFGEDLPILTGEVRQVMDRMLATDEQIKRQAAINEMKPQFQTQEQSGMDDAEWAAYQAMQQEAIEASITDMNKASMRQLQWLGNARSRILRDMQRKHDAKRKEVAAEMAAELRVEPVYRAMTYLRTGKFIDADGAEVEMEGPHRLDIKQVKAIYAGMPSEADVEPIRATGMAVPVTRPQFERLGYGKYGMLAEDGVAPDLVAETFGYSSGDQMIRALLEAKPIKEAVAERTDAEMLRRFGDMNTPEAREAEVQKALHNEARARFVAVELRHIARATEPVRVMVEAAKQVARELIAGTTVRDVRPADFIAAEARAARDASRMGTTINPAAVGQAAQTRAYNEAIEAGTDPAEAMAAAIEKGAEAARKAQERSDALKAQYGADPQQALIRAKRAQLYQNQLAAEALRVREEVAKQVKYLRRILRDTNVKAMGAQAADQIAGLLERFEVAPVSLKRLDERKALAAWLAEQEAAGLVPDIAPEIVNEARRVNYREVKVSEFRDLVDAIRQIEHIGKRERKAAQEKLRAEFDALKDEAIQSMKDVAAKRGRKARKELGDEDRKWAQLIAGYDAMQQTIGSIVYVLDGGQRDGPLARMLLFTANDAGNQETTDRADATLALSKILDPIERKGQFSGRKLYFPQIDDSLSLEQRMVVALNYGNQSNIDRLLNGEKWTEEQVQPILESLTEEQLNAVQAIWNYLESFKPRVAAQERNLLGREPNWIKPRPFTVRSADGKIVNMAGGYYPAKYNPRRSSMSREMDESVEADRQMREAITAATTTRSYTKNRLDKPPEGGVLSRQMGGLYAGVNEVIHDLSWRTWAMDANRLLRDKEFQTVINSIYGRETYAAIKNWVDATVRGERGNYDVIENIAIGVRRNVSVSAMGLKFITAVIQVTGLIPATVRTGITPMVRAVAYFAASPRESSRIAREKSSFMRNRGRTRYRDLNEIANIVRGESRARRAYLANAYALIGLQQGMVDVSVWWAAYSNAIKEGKAEEMAVSIADQTVIDTQGSGMLKDLSQAMRGGQKQSAYAKLFTSFYQFSNTQYALLSAQLRTAPSMGKAAADAFTILVVGAFIEEMLRTLLKPSPDDEEPEDLAKALIANQIDFVIGLPFGGGELRGIGDMIVGEQAMQYRGPSGLRMVGEVRTFAGQTLQGEFDRAWTRSAINMSGLIWGIPSAQINDTIDGIEAVIEGEVEGPTAVLAPLTGVQR